MCASTGKGGLRGGTGAAAGAEDRSPRRDRSPVRAEDGTASSACARMEGHSATVARSKRDKDRRMNGKKPPEPLKRGLSLYRAFP